MIPKVIHYCWFGGNQKNENIKKCIASWKKYCPDYEIIEWNEFNYDVAKHPFMKKAYESKKWAFVSDYARIDILYHNGGIYLDTDVELISNLDPFLKWDFFAGFENESFVSFGLGYGSVEGHPILKDILGVYDGLEFPDSQFALSTISCPRIQTEILCNYGMVRNNRNQIIDAICIYNTEYFSPMSFKTGETVITSETVSIHHFDMSWVSGNLKRAKEREWRLLKKYGAKRGRRISSLMSFPGKIIANVKDGTLVEYICFLIKRKLR